MTRVYTLVTLFALAAGMGSGAARAAPLEVGLSEDVVKITIGFAGAAVTLFGAIEKPGDVVVIVKGPTERVSMRRKSRIGGIWINTATMTFENVPSFYFIASSRPLEEIAKNTVLARFEMGVERLKLKLPKAKASPNVAQAWREALVRNKQREGLYPTEVEKVSFLGDRLFRTEVVFPDSVPTGPYLVNVYVVKDKKDIEGETFTLKVEKSGIEAEIFDFAHQQGALYGIIAILVALVAGWLAHVAFRKG